MGRLTGEAKVQLMRRNYAAYSRGDFDVVIEAAHPDIVLVRAGKQGELKGAEPFRAWLEPDAFSSQILEPSEFEVAGNRVLAHVHGTLIGAGSGIEMKLCSWTVWTFDEEGRVTRIEVFLAHERAEARCALLAR